MSRTLKFKSWDKTNKKWALDGLEFHAIGETALFNLLDQYSVENFADLEIVQFTGMKDRKGKPVYEGDIVCGSIEPPYETNAHVGEIHFAAGAFIIDGVGTMYDQVLSISPDILDGWEIIGNIFEYKHLLGGK